MTTKYDIRVDRTKPLENEPRKGHNRWHPHIPPILTVDPGDIVVMEARDGADGQVNWDTVDADIPNVDLGRIHPLTGPIYVRGAEPGDVLEIKILDVVPEPFGFTLITPGFGLLREHFPKPSIVKWEIRGKSATSPQLPGVVIPGAPFMGVMGVAPSHTMLQRIAAREAELLHRGGLVFPPSPQGAVPSSGSIKAEGLTTIAPREIGGNGDIKHLTAGTTLLLPVFEPGGLFSAGDGHFAQGDGESCGTAIETGTTLTVQFDVLKGEARTKKMRGPHYRRNDYFTSPEFAVPKRFYATTGLPVTLEGRNESENLRLAAQNAVLSMIDYLACEHGFTSEQAYIIVSVAVDLHISTIVGASNVLVSAFLPLDIFVT